MPCLIIFDEYLLLCEYTLKSYLKQQIVQLLDFMENLVSLFNTWKTIMILFLIVTAWSVSNFQQSGANAYSFLNNLDKNQLKKQINAPKMRIFEQPSKDLQVDEQYFYIANQIDLKQKDGAVKSFSSIAYRTFNNISMVSVTENNRVITYVCEYSMLNCNKSNNIQIDSSVQIYYHSIADDMKVMVLGGSNGKLYVYQKNQSSTDDFSFVNTLDSSNSAIKSTKMTANGFKLFAGGSQKIARYYIYNSSSPNLYSQVQAFNPTPSQIITVTNLQVAGRNNYLFIAYDQGIRVLILNRTTDKFEQAYILNVSSISIIASPVTVTSQGVGVIAVGCNDGTVKMFQFLGSSQNLSLVQNIVYQFGAVVSLTLSQNGKFLAIGNHNKDTFVFKKNILDNGTYNWTLFSTLRFSDDMANFAKVMRFRSDGNFFVTGSDDFFLRFYKLGVCPDGTTFDNLGRCVPKSYWLIYAIIGGSIVLLIGIIILVLKYKKRIPAQVKKRIIDIQQDDIKVKTDREAVGVGSQKKSYSR